MNNSHYETKDLKIEGRKYFLAFFPVVAINQICPQSDCKNKNNFETRKTNYIQ